MNPEIIQRCRAILSKHDDETRWVKMADLRALVEEVEREQKEISQAPPSSRVAAKKAPKHGVQRRTVDAKHPPESGTEAAKKKATAHVQYSA